MENITSAIKEIEWNFKDYSLIATGLTAEIYLAYDNKNEKYAIKLFQKGSEEFFNNEISIMSKFTSFKNVIQIFGFGKTPKGLEKIENRNFIVLEYACNLDLFEYVNKIGMLGEENSKHIFKSILEGVEEIHKSGIVHRDLKLENILVNKDFELKIIDFGFSEEISKISKEAKGTAGYLAPEVYYLKEIKDGTQLDTFSLGVVLFILVTGGFPFDNPNGTDLLYKYIFKEQLGDYWAIMSKIGIEFSVEFKNLFQNLVCFAPYKRLKLIDIKNHPWLSQCAQVNTQEILKKMKSKIDERL